MIHCYFEFVALQNEKNRAVLNFAHFDSLVCIVARSREKISLALARPVSRSLPLTLALASRSNSDQPLWQYQEYCACCCRYSDFVVQNATVHSRKSEIHGKCAGQRHSGKPLGKNSVSIQHLNLKSDAMFPWNTAENYGSRLVSWCGSTVLGICNRSSFMCNLCSVL